MYPVSVAFLDALRHSHTAISRVDLLQRGTVLASGISVIGGDVSDDSSSLVRKRCGLTLVPDDDALAYLAQSPPDDGGLWPLGNELKLYGGIRFGDGTEELASMGVFRISRPRIAHTPAAVGITIEGFDRGRSVSRARFTQPYSVAKGTNYAEAIKELIKSRLPWMLDSDFNFMETNYTTPALTWLDEDPWRVAQDMASSLGAELLWDGDGRCVLRPEPDPAYTPSSFDYVAGEEATVKSINRDLDDEQAYNGVIVTSSSTGLTAPIRAEVWDTDPASPTRYDPADPEASLYGAVPYFMSSQYITTQAQAQDAAGANLARVTGIIESIDFTAINNPAHTSGDVIRVGDPDIGVDALYILDAVRTGIGESFDLSGTTRKRRVA